MHRNPGPEPPWRRRWARPSAKQVPSCHPDKPTAGGTSGTSTGVRSGKLQRQMRAGIGANGGRKNTARMCMRLPVMGTTGRAQGVRAWQPVSLTEVPVWFQLAVTWTCRENYDLILAAGILRMAKLPLRSAVSAAARPDERRARSHSFRSLRPTKSHLGLRPDCPVLIEAERGFVLLAKIPLIARQHP